MCAVSFSPDSRTSLILELTALCSYFQSCKMHVKLHYALFTRLVLSVWVDVCLYQAVQVCKYFLCKHRRGTSANIGYCFTYTVHIGKICKGFWSRKVTTVLYHMKEKYLLALYLKKDKSVWIWPNVPSQEARINEFHNCSCR